MKQVNTRSFSDIVRQFLADCCEKGEQFRVSDRVLFRKFRDYWQQVSKNKQYPALLGQFRVTLTESGYRSSDGKRPQWYGLALRKKQARAGKQPAASTGASPGTIPAPKGRNTEQDEHERYGLKTPVLIAEIIF